MRVSLIKDDYIKDMILPDQINGSFWLTDYDENGNERNLLTIEGTNQGWKLISNDDVFCIVNNKKAPSVWLREHIFYMIKDRYQNTSMLVYCQPVGDKSYQLYDTESLAKGITIGSDNRADILYDTDLIAPFHARIALVNFQNDQTGSTSKLIITEQDSANNVSANKRGIYINNQKISGSYALKNNDVIFIMGLKILVSRMGGKYIFRINNPNEKVFVKLRKIDSYAIQRKNDFTEDEEEIEMLLYNPDDYFYKKPRFINKIETLELSIDAPPSKQEDPNTSVLLTVGPMLTMSMTSLVMGYAAINGIANKTSTWSQAMPSLIICIAMFGSIFIWPFITKAYEKRRRERGEKDRQKKYSKYIENKRKIIQEEVVRQEKILKYSYPTTYECQQIILEKTDRLWERRPDDEDFLTINLGVGNQEMKIDIRYPEDHFSMVEDNLKDVVTKLGTEPKTLNNVPIELSLLEYKILAIVGENRNNHNLMSQLLLQILSLHSYDDLKVVILTNKGREKQWEDFRVAPHLFSNDRTIRYFGSDSSEHKEICYNLEHVYLSRKNNEETSDGDFELETPGKTTATIPHYLIITDSFKSVRGYDVIKKLLEEKDNVGFSLIILNDTISSLPEQCQTFINSGAVDCSVFKSLLNNKTQNFKLINMDYNYELCTKVLTNIPIEIDLNESGKLPDKIGFMQMYDSWQIEQLNIMNRWKKNNPGLSLAAPVGVGRNGDKISLDLHEKYHGPHGLIAGMTGSGKSEFIITYILSMAVNYHPYEVQFILIDYKGGGLAGAFENKNSGIKLPHLVGTITNLDTNEIQRSFASLESELKRRQAAFNKAREISGESTVDIYKYQKMYREGVVKEPVSHLFIICDEFAELKVQQPDFMDQLISTARIGRSLGVHLILATQKPSGVVDPQIWSNTRFRVCLRVQEKSDSSEVIKCPDAAFLKQTGRFYFQVGFNEIFELGQAAWAGGPYTPTEKIRRNVDNTINFINNIGYTIKSIDTKKKQENVAYNGEELSNIVSYISNIATKQSINCKPLWLEKIPDRIYITDLIKKYNYQKEANVINPVIGEYDNPNMQQQHLLTLPLTKEGNALIYGAAGNGKENLINTIIYSSMLFYSPSEINYYILDFGSESLKVFNQSPLVGDILLSSDEDKIENLFKMVSKTIEDRKKLFAEYGGDFTTYCKSTKKQLPAIVVIINNYENYQELEEDYEEELVNLTRDCVKYGVYFIATVTTPNGMRFKLKQNFNHEYVLGQNNDDDYITILGSVGKTYPAKVFGRGIIKTDNVYEFQSAFIADDDNVRDYIKSLSDQIKQKYPESAPKVKQLPEIVSYKDIKDDLGKTDDLVVGIYKQTLEPATFNYLKNTCNIITAVDIGLGYALIKPIINQMLLAKKRITFINAEDYILEAAYNKYISYTDTKFDDMFENLSQFINENHEKYVNANYDKKVLTDVPHTTVIINGISSFKDKLNEENQAKFAEIFEKANGLGIVNYIIIDSIDKIRKFEAEPWYRSTVNQNEGIWIGNGINDQFSLKVTQKTKDSKLEIDDNYCFVIKRGKPELAKIIEDFEVEL